MIKFKYSSLNIPKEYITHDLRYYTIVNNPIGIENLPNGEYMIRGNKKHYRKMYLLIDSIWYLTEDIVKDNGHYMCDSAKYNLFPCLTNKEWEALKLTGYKKLNKVWQRHLYGHWFWLDLERIRKNAKISALNVFKNIKNDRNI